MIFPHLAVLQEFKAAQDRRGWDVIVRAGRADFGFADHFSTPGGHNPAALHGIAGARTSPF